MPTLGPLELIVILVVILLLFGPARLGEAGKSIGKAAREFRKVTEENSVESLLSPDPKPEPPSPVKETEQDSAAPISTSDLKQELVTQSGELPLMVFISSMIGELLEARAAVKQTIDSLPLTSGWLFEEAPAVSDELEASYLQKVEACDLYILLVGQNISEPVIREYNLAQARKKPCLVFVRKVSRSLQAEEFLKGVQFKWKEFETLEELQREIMFAVGLEIIKGYRRYRLSREQALGLILFLTKQGYTDIPKLPDVEPERDAEPTHDEPSRRISIEHEMILISAGWFTMGSDEYDDEKPIHRVHLPAYRISKYPVTNEQFARFVQLTGYKTDVERKGMNTHGNTRAARTATSRR